MLAMADCGMRSQFTTSPNGSLTRTPSWKIDTPCGVPSKRRGAEAAKADVRLEGIALRRVRGDASGVLLQVVGDVRLALTGEVLARIDLHVRRHIPNRRAEAGERRRADHLDRGHFQRFRGILAGPGSARSR